MVALEPNRFYHVFNRANGHEKVFLNNENYIFFLKQYSLYISPYVNTYTYCLMPNHFHFLVSIKSETEILEFLDADRNLQGFAATQRGPNLEGLSGPDKIEKLISFQFSRFLNSYAKAFNRVTSRKGSLFMKNFKRKPITNQKYLLKLIHYIHNNPVEAGFVNYPEDWKYSSYGQILNLSQSFVNSQEVILWFNDLENFKYFHRLSPQLEETE